MSDYAGSFGIDKLDKTVDFPEDKEVAKIRVKSSKNWVNEMEFRDSANNLICAMRADSGVGDWYDIPLEEGERILGFKQSEDGTGYIRKFAFAILKA